MAHTILIVEDDADEEYLLVKAFREVAHDVGLQVVRDGVEAIEYMRGAGNFGDRTLHPLPTLVLLDLKLPRRDGFEVLTLLKADPNLRHTPIVVLSGACDGETVARAADLGANAFLAKPESFPAARDTVRTLTAFWLGLHQQVRK